MEVVITWGLIFIICLTAIGIILSFILYANLFVLNLFYHLFTGKNLKIYEKISYCFKDF